MINKLYKKNGIISSLVNCQRGAAMAIYTIIVMSAALIMASVSAEAGFFDITMTYRDQKATEALYIVEGCVEDTLRRIDVNSDYGIGSGEIELSVLSGSCIIEVRDEGGGERLITAEGTAYDEGNYEFHKLIYVVVLIDQNTKELIMTGWTEI
ncbi:hypothetical protein ISS03_01400 [Patescibacteria group bacterium]|nr:hypothetical protein [Patescibacteria group bacterium]